MRKVIMWTQEHCPMCERVRALFAADDVKEHDVSDLIVGRMKNDEALAQLAMQDMQVPLVQIDGRFVNVHALLREEAA